MDFWSDAQLGVSSFRLSLQIPWQNSDLDRLDKFKLKTATIQIIWVCFLFRTIHIDLWTPLKSRLTALSWVLRPLAMHHWHLKILCQCIRLVQTMLPFWKLQQASDREAPGHAILNSYLLKYVKSGMNLGELKHGCLQHAHGQGLEQPREICMVPHWILEQQASIMLSSKPFPSRVKCHVT